MAHRLAPQADIDLDDIWLYVAKESGSLDIADKLIDSLTARFWLLSRYPYIGRRRDEDLRQGLRSFAAGKHIILYRVEGQDVIILRVASGNRDLQALLRH